MSSIPCTIVYPGDWKARYLTLDSLEAVIAWSKAHPAAKISPDSDPNNYYLDGAPHAYQCATR